MLDDADIQFKNYKNVSPMIQLIMFDIYKAQAKYLRLNDAEFDSIKYYYQALKLSEVIYHPQHKTRQRLLKIYNELSDQFQIEIIFNEDDKNKNKKMNMKQPMKNYSVMVNSIYTKRKNIVLSKPQVKRPASAKPTQPIFRPISAKIPEYKKAKPAISVNKTSRPQSSTTAPKQSLTFRLNSKHIKPFPYMQPSTFKDVEAIKYQRILDLMIERPQSHHVPEIIISQPPIQENHSQRQTIIEREMSKQQIQTLTMRKSSSSAVPSFQFINRERESQRKIQAPKELNVEYPGSKMTQSARQLTNPQVTDELEDENDSSDHKFDNLMDDFDEVLNQDNVLGFYLKKYSQQQLEKAIDIIITWYREQVLRRNLNIPIKPKQSPNKIARGSTIQIKQQKTNTGFISVMNNLLNENETSKSLLFLFENALKLGSKPIYFYSQLFKDSCTQLWMLKSPKVKIQILQKDGRIHLTEDIEIIRNEFQSIQTRNLDTFALQCTIQLENYSQKMQFRFIIDNVLDCLNELEQFQDIMNLFNQLITVYLQQNDIYVSWQDQHHEQLILYRGGDVGQLLLSKVLFLIHKLKYVKAINGYKFKWEGQQHDTNILKSNNKIYQEQKCHIQQIFQINKSEYRRAKAVSVNQRKVRRNRNLVIVRSNPDYNDSTPVSKLGDASPQLSYQNTGMIIETSQQSINYNFSPDTPMIRRIDKQPERFSHLITPQWKSLKAYTEQQFSKIEEIFSLEMQDFLEYYFPDFPLALPPEVYDPNPLFHDHQPKQPKIDYEVSGHYDNYKYRETKYSNILPFQYIILTQIIKLDNQYYLITLSNKLQIQQLLLKDTWSDEIRISLSDLIDFKIGRTGYILDKIKLQEEIISRIQIENCKVYLMPRQVQNKNQLFKNQMWNYIQENLNVDNIQKRDRDVDSVFLLSLNNNSKVYVYKQIHLPFVNYVDESYIQLKPEEPKIKLKMPSRLLLSFEDINKHISRTYDNTILGDVTLFKKYNSIFSMYTRKLFKPLKIKFIIQYDGDLYRQYKQNNISGYVVVFLKYYYKVILNSQQIEQWAHILSLEGKMQEFHIKNALQFKRTISGKQLPQIMNKKTVSKDIRILMFQGKVKTKDVFQQAIIPNIGKVFIKTSALKGIGSNLFLIEIQQMKERTKVHKFMIQCNECTDYSSLQDSVYTISKYFQLKPTATYKRLFMTQITTNSLKQQYLLSNNFRDNIIMKAVKPHARIIYKQVRRFNKHFYIITIFKLLNHFQIVLYNQNTCRRFSIRLHSCDFYKFGEDFLNQILPKQQEEVLAQLFRPWTLQEINKIYGLLIKAPELFKQKTKRIITSIDLKRSQTLRSSSRRSNTLTPSMRASIYNKQQSVNMEELDLQDQEIQFKDNFLYNLLIKQTHSSVFEMKLWMELTKDLKLKENYLVLDSERFLLTEIIYNNYQHIYFETYMDCTETHQLYRWQPARFRIYFYENYRVIDQPLIFRGKQFQMQNQSDKLYHNYINNKVLPPQQDRIIVNKSNDSQLHGYQLIYKGVFTKTQMMAIFYISEEFQIKIWNSEKSIIRKFTMSQIEQKIPFAKFLIQLKPYEVGRRIYLTYRNQLIHAAFFNL